MRHATLGWISFGVSRGRCFRGSGAGALWRCDLASDLGVGFGVRGGEFRSGLASLGFGSVILSWWY